MSGGRIALLVAGSVLALVALGLLVSGCASAVVHATQRDDDGYYSTRSERLESDGYAIASDDLDLGEEGGSNWLFDEGRLATLRLEARRERVGRELFLGIGRKDDVERYLAGVPHSVVVDVEIHPFRPEYREESGSRAPAPPESQRFWVASGDRTLEWEVEEGDWVAVAMNADGSRFVRAQLSVGAKTDLLLWAAVILLPLGLLLAGVAALLIVLSLRGERHPSPAQLEMALPVGEGEYPVHLEGVLEPGLSRWLWLVKWLLLIPHFIVLVFLWAALAVTTIVAFFAILFTERYPRGLFGFNVGVLRWTWRVAWYGYGGLATDRYPPFTLADIDYPARLQIPYPERLSRGLVLVKWWLLAIPHYLVIGFFLGGAWWWFEEYGGPGLIFLLVVFAGVVLLFRNRYPRDLYELVLGLDRWVVRVAAYVLLLRDEYPPFRLRP
jgi:Domain of unknown function (DUF4389)